MIRIFLILVLIPLFTFAQPTDFTKEQDKFVDNFVKEIPNKNYTSNEDMVSDLEKALEEVPYHPVLVYAYLDVFMTRYKEYNFVSNYCQKLSFDYLVQNQDILCGRCMVSFNLNKDLELLNDNISLIEDKDIRNLYKAVYFYELNEGDKFIEYASKLINNEVFENVNSVHGIYIIKVLKNLVFTAFVYHLTSTEKTDTLVSILDANQDLIASKEMDFVIFSIVANVAISNDMLRLSEKLLNNSFANYPSQYKYIPILKAFLASKKGDENEAILQLTRSLLLDDSVFDVYFSSELNFYMVYINILVSLKDFESKVRIVNDMLDFFEGRSPFVYRTKLYQSMLYASKDLEKAKNILESCKPKIDASAYEVFKVLIEIENELHKETPDYKSIDAQLSNFEEIMPEFNYLSIKYFFHEQVNTQNNAEVFEANKMISYLERLIELSDNENDQLLFVKNKIEILAITDIDRANEELDKLGFSESDKVEIFGDEFFGLTDTNTTTKPKKNCH